MLLLPKEPPNLFNIDDANGGAPWSTSTPDIAGSGAYGSKLADGTLRASMGAYGAGIIWTGAKIPIEKGGNYYISCEIKIDSSIKTSATQPNYDLVNKTKNKGSGRKYVTAVKERDVWMPITFPVATVPDDWVGDDIYLSTQIIGDATQYTNLPAYFRNIKVTYEE
jgi:hypothetical protein